MPVLRYFVFVGGALLALLLVCNVVFPQVPLPATLKSASDLPAIRIQSERKWPERVVFDTTLPAVAPVKFAQVDAASVGSAQKAGPREAFAQMGTGEAKQVTASSSAKAAEPAMMKVADATALKTEQTSPKTEQKSEFNRQPPKRKVAKLHPSRPMIVVAQQPQPHFGFFDSTW